MQRTSVRLGNGEGKADVHLENTTRECLDIIIRRGFATNVSEAIRVAVAWCALAISAYEAEAIIASQIERDAPAPLAPAAGARRRNEVPPG